VQLESLREGGCFLRGALRIVEHEALVVDRRGARLAEVDGVVLVGKGAVEQLALDGLLRRDEPLGA
jgi:hypothetical protein